MADLTPKQIEQNEWLTAAIHACGLDSAVGIRDASGAWHGAGPMSIYVARRSTVAEVNEAATQLQRDAASDPRVLAKLRAFMASNPAPAV